MLQCFLTASFMRNILSLECFSNLLAFNRKLSDSNLRQLDYFLVKIRYGFYLQTSSNLNPVGDLISSAYLLPLITLSHALLPWPELINKVKLPQVSYDRALHSNFLQVPDSLEVRVPKASPCVVILRRASKSDCGHG